MLPTRFERPHAALAESYRALVRDFIDHHETLIPFPLTFPNDDFPSLVARLAAYERGEGLPKGFVPHSTFWLVAGGEVVAVSNLRHQLTDALRIEGGNIGYGVRPGRRRRGHASQLLGHTLGEARALGLEEVLLTCSKSNAASIATILGHGGALEGEAFIEKRRETVQRYVITL
jgi:predicted acetyltransferase